MKALVNYNRTAAQGAAFRIRGLTRRVDSESAKELLAEYPDLELVAGDITKREDLDRLFAGATHAFVVTTWGNELEIGSRIAESAKNAYVFYTSLCFLPKFEAKTDFSFVGVQRFELYLVVIVAQCCQDLG